MRLVKKAMITLGLMMVVTTSFNINCKNVKAEENDKLLLKEPEVITTIDMKEKAYSMCLYGDKIVISIPEDGMNYAFPKMGLYNLEGKKLLDNDNDEIKITKDGSVYVKDSKGLAYLYDKNMKLLKSTPKDYVDSNYDLLEPSGYVYVDKSNNNDDFFNEYKVKTNKETCAFDILDKNGNVVYTYKIGAGDDFSKDHINEVLDAYNYYSIDSTHLCIFSYPGNITTVDAEKKEIHSFETDLEYYVNKVRYYEDLKAYYIDDAYVDSGDIRIKPSKYYDMDGNDVFENDLGIDVKQYLGDGYLCYEKDGKVTIGKISLKNEKVEKEETSVKSTDKNVKTDKKVKKSKIGVIVPVCVLFVLIILSIIILLKNTKNKRSVNE